MGWILIWAICGAAGFWLGSHRLVPSWAIVVLLFLGTGMWCLGEWQERQERQEAHGDDED